MEVSGAGIPGRSDPPLAKWRKRSAPREGIFRKMRELLRLRYDLKLGQVQIARSCNLGQSTVFRYLKTIRRVGFVLAFAGELQRPGSRRTAVCQACHWSARRASAD